MHARVTIGQFPPDRVDEAMRVYNEHAVPAMREQRGFRGVLMLVDGATGKGMSISMWDTETDMAAGESSGYYRTQIARFAQLLETAPTLEHYEVKLQA